MPPAIPQPNQQLVTSTWVWLEPEPCSSWEPLSSLS